MSSGAPFSDCGRYRYLLWREWAPDRGRLLWIMLNPSTADASRDDPTITRCKERAYRLGYGGIEVVNLFALRATNPKALKAVAYPTGIENDRHIAAATGGKRQIIAAWGSHGAYRNRGVAVRRVLEECGVLHRVLVLGLTKGGEPKHPLYVGYDVRPKTWLPLAAPRAALAPEGEGE